MAKLSEDLTAMINDQHLEDGLNEHFTSLSQRAVSLEQQVESLSQQLIDSQNRLNEMKDNIVKHYFSGQPLNNEEQSRDEEPSYSLDELLEYK